MRSKIGSGLRGKGMPQPAWLVYGPPGCGKTTWILSHVKQSNAKLYHWNARTDRTLREGRESLHRQVRSQEPLYVWIEGADDLTPESQAFLRRILETVSPSVQCILECRDPNRITPAIQSRCEWKQPVGTESFRKIAQGKKVSATTTSISSAFMNGENPIDQIKEFLEREDTWEEALLALRAIGSGGSPWARLLYLKSMRL
jgi:DNA polymerase III delta prime subunit